MSMSRIYRAVLDNMSEQVFNARMALGNHSGVLRIRTGATGAGKVREGVLFPTDWRRVADVFAFLEVAGNGCGIDETRVGRVFDPFFSDKFEGNGVGLTEALGIVKAYQGCITVESKPVRGSTFRVFLPVSTKQSGEGERDGAMDGEKTEAS